MPLPKPVLISLAGVSLRLRRALTSGIEPSSRAGAELAARGVESPDRADALIGSIMMRLNADPYAFNPEAAKAASETMQWALRRIERSRPIGYEPCVNWNSAW